MSFFFPFFFEICRICSCKKKKKRKKNKCFNVNNNLGMVSSALVWGYLADVKGRKSILIYGFLADGICNVLSGFSQNFGTLLFFKFLSGLM